MRTGCACASLRRMGTRAGAVIAVGLVGLALAPAASAQGKTCGPTSGYTEVARSEKGRVLVKGKPRKGPGGSKAATTAVACRFRDGAVQSLGTVGEDEDMIGMSGFTMTGPRIAYFVITRTDMGDSGDSTSSNVVQEVLGRKRSFAGPGVRSYADESEVDAATQIVVAPDGAMAWAACESDFAGGPFPTTCRRVADAEWAVFGATAARLRDDDLEPRRLAKGKGKSPTMLSLNGGVVRFVQAARRRSARL